MNLFAAILCFFVASTCTTMPPNNGNLFQTDSPSVTQSTVTLPTKHAKHNQKKIQKYKLQQARRKALDELFPEVARRVQAIHKKPTSELPTAVTGHCKMNKCRDCKHTEKTGIQRCKPTLCTHKDCPYAPSSQSPIPRDVQDSLG